MIMRSRSLWTMWEVCLSALVQWAWRPLVSRSVPITVHGPSLDLKPFRRLRSRRLWRMLVVFIAMKFVTVPLTFLAFSLVTNTVKAETPPAASQQEQVSYKTVTGEVSGVGAKFIAVEYERNTKKGAAFEMALPVDEAATLERIKQLKELKLGDTVRVEYQETATKDDKGQYTNVRRVATKIALLRTAPQEALSSKEEVAE